MNKSKELTNMQAVVKEILQNYPKTRNSDKELFVNVCRTVCPEILSQPFWYAFSDQANNVMPNFETVRRTRQKIQAAHPELAADADVEEMRMVNEEAFREYAVSAE